MKVKLKKISDTEWMGNGFGTRSAEWSIVGHPGYILSGSTGDWSVWNNRRGRITTANSRNDAAQQFVDLAATDPDNYMFNRG